MQEDQTNDEVMLTLTTIRQSKPGRNLIAHLDKHFRVEQISAEKCSIYAQSMDKVGNEIEKFAKEFSKEMEYSATPKVGMTIFASLASTNTTAFILTNERAHRTKKQAEAIRKPK